MHCESCHGAGGVGDGPAAGGLTVPPSDLTDGVQMGFISDAGFMEVISSGLTETGMPAYGERIDAADQVDLYAYTKTLRVTPPKDEHSCAARPGANHFPTLPILAAVGLLVSNRRKKNA
jgi:mono/diheme cytochrome c family protein